MSLSVEAFPLSLLISRESNDSELWIAHVLELDLVTQGDGVVNALQMAEEAANMLITDDLNRGRKPFDRWAPKECWDRFRAVERDGQQHKGSVEDLVAQIGSGIGALAARMTIVFFRVEGTLEAGVPSASTVRPLPSGPPTFHPNFFTNSVGLDQRCAVN